MGRRLRIVQMLLMLSIMAHQKCQVMVDASKDERATLEAATEHQEGDLMVYDEGALELYNNYEEVYYEDDEDESTTSSTTSGESSPPSSEKNKDVDIIVVVAVDGALAGLSKETGQILWKQQPSQLSTTRTDKDSGNFMKTTPGKKAFKENEFFRPLISTTTTTKSAATSDYAAVPSVDGNVYMTIRNDDAITTSIKELVNRAPFLDNRGRFYVGSRQATAAALDGSTGEVLRVLSSAGSSSSNSNAPVKSLKGRNAVWIGRVDYSVQIQNARTGMTDVQFSVAEVMSVTDMQRPPSSHVGSAARPGRDPSDDVNDEDDEEENNMHPSLFTLPAEPAELKDGKHSFDAAVAVATAKPSVLIATPSGNLAFRNLDSQGLDWVASESFDTPIAFAMDVSTGATLGVDIIPDVPVPKHSSLEYLSREMERQLELLSETEDRDSDNTIVGALKSTGQLYALPLGRRRTVSHHAAIPHAKQAIAGTSTKHVAVPLVGRKSSATLQHHHHSDKKVQCHPSNSNYPGCLVQIAYSGHKGGLDYLSKSAHENAKDDGGLAVMTMNNDNTHQYQQQQDLIYHPEFGYISPAAFHQHHQHQMYNRSKYHKLFKILGSWLPPTIALIFVMSFELGRRKRLKDNLKVKETILDEANNMLLAENSQLQNNNYAMESSKMEQQQQQYVIQVSDEVLGYGGQGTVVYKGLLDGRDVAVKRLLKAYHASADREISLLIESDGHPNVVRYFLKEVRFDFVYLALELCDLSLHDLIGVLRITATTMSAVQQLENDNAEAAPLSGSPRYINNTILWQTRAILQQIVSGVKHLHSLRIVHRDLKPANILLAISKKGKKKITRDENTTVFDTYKEGYYVAKISDMGLGKQLVGQSSLGVSMIADSSFRGGAKSGTASVGVGPGSVGWQAPEVMALRWAASDASARSRDSSLNGAINAESSPSPANNETPNASAALTNSTSTTSRSVDIFSLGCIFYSTLVPGFHPFGEWFEREANIMHNRPCIDTLKELSPDAYDLVRAMLQRNAKLRPTAKQICEHPFFWTSQQKLTFLCEFSDRLETDGASEYALKVNALAIERGAVDIVGTSWDKRLDDDSLLNNVQKFRSYDPSSARDLLRLIRNKVHHFDELPTEFRESNHISNQDTLLEYFEARFPLLLMHCYNFCKKLLKEDDPLAAKYSIVPFPKPDVNIKHSSSSLPTPKSVIVEREASQTSEKPENGGSSDNGANLEKTESRDGSGGDQTDEPTLSTVTPPLIAQPESLEAPEDIIVWEGSTAAKTLNCRGWSRSEDEWADRIDPIFRKKDLNLKRGLDDPKFRTRLCNHWDQNLGTLCPMKKKNKCVFAHGPAELRVKEGKKNRWGRLVDKNGNNSNPWHSGGEDTYGAAKSIETVRKVEGKWNTGQGQTPPNKGKKPGSAKKKSRPNQSGSSSDNKS